MFLEILVGVPQGSILGQIIFNIFINNFVEISKNADIHNFVDDNTLSTHSRDANEVVKCLEGESEKAIQWFTENHMIVNPGKFKAILIKKDVSDTIAIGTQLFINNKYVHSSSEVTLLELTIDNKLSFNKRILQWASGSVHGDGEP